MKYQSKYLQVNNFANGRTAMENIVIDGDSYTMSYEYENDDGAVYPENELCKITYSGTNVSCAAEYIRDGYGRQSDRKITVGGNTKCKESRTYMDIALDGEYTHGKTTRFVTQLKNTFGGTTETLTYTYTNNCEIQTVKVGNTVKQKFTYDALGRLTREDNKALNKTTVYTYDERGRMSSKRISAYTTASDPTGSTINYAYASDHLSGRITEYNGKKLSDYKSAPYDSDGYPLVYFKHSGTGHYVMTWGNEYNI